MSTDRSRMPIWVFRFSFLALIEISQIERGEHTTVSYVMIFGGECVLLNVNGTQFRRRTFCLKFRRWVFPDPLPCVVSGSVLWGLGSGRVFCARCTRAGVRAEAKGGAPLAGIDGISQARAWSCSSPLPRELGSSYIIYGQSVWCDGRTIALRPLMVGDRRSSVAEWATRPGWGVGVGVGRACARRLAHVSRAVTQGGAGPRCTLTATSVG